MQSCAIAASKGPGCNRLSLWGHIASKGFGCNRLISQRGVVGPRRASAETRSSRCCVFLEGVTGPSVVSPGCC